MVGRAAGSQACAPEIALERDYVDYEPGSLEVASDEEPRGAETALREEDADQASRDQIGRLDWVA